MHSGTSGLVRSGTGTLVPQGGTVRIQDGGSAQTDLSPTVLLHFYLRIKTVNNPDGVTITGDTPVVGNPTAGTGTVGGLTSAGTQIVTMTAHRYHSKTILK